MRLGIFGGSFDPVHNGHLALARACQQQAALDEVWFTPTAVQPLKQKGPHATDAQRLEMLRLAILPEPSWRVCTLEIDRGGLSYTVDTLRQLKRRTARRRAVLPDGRRRRAATCRIGASRARSFRLATPLVVRRAGEAGTGPGRAARLSAPRINSLELIEMPAVDVSSTEIRRRAAAGKSIDDLVPPSVADYIASQKTVSVKTESFMPHVRITARPACVKS